MWLRVMRASATVDGPLQTLTAHGVLQGKCSGTQVIVACREASFRGELCISAGHSEMLWLSKHGMFVWLPQVPVSAVLAEPVA
jgi:hypothetical protein